MHVETREDEASDLERDNAGMERRKSRLTSGRVSGKAGIGKKG